MSNPFCQNCGKSKSVCVCLQNRCPKCGYDMLPIESVPPQKRCTNCRWTILLTDRGEVGVTHASLGKGNRTKGPRPHLKGKTGRTKPGRPAGSGRPKVFTDPVNLTIVVERADKDFWKREAASCNLTLGEYIRATLENDY